MRKLIFIITILGGILSSCNTKNNPTSKLLPESDIVMRLRLEKNKIDTLFSRKRQNTFDYAKFDLNNDAFPVKTDTVFDNAVITYSILNDSLDNIVSISEFPYSKSGDWYIVLSHYFDKSGKTFAFERQANYFNSGCTEGVAYETTIKFYNSDFELIYDDNKLIDKNKNPLQKDSCTSMYDFEYKVSANVKEYLKENKIKTSW